jgi:hypothetical protein
VNSGAKGPVDRFDGPVTVELLADLQAGLLDDRTAAGLRQRARTDPDVARRLATLDRVRRDVADLGTDSASAAEVPAGVTARIGTALRGEPPAGAKPPFVRFRTAAALAGLTALVAAGAVGTTMLVKRDSLGPTVSEPTASLGTPARARGSVPLPDAQILALLDRPAELGALANPQRRASCLGGLGYPTATAVLGARPLDVMGRPGVLLLLPGDAPSRIEAVVVAPSCSSVDTGLLASTVVIRT